MPMVPGGTANVLNERRICEKRKTERIIDIFRVKVAVKVRAPNGL